jgi:hypothetical protein
MLLEHFILLHLLLLHLLLLPTFLHHLFLLHHLLLLAQQFGFWCKNELRVHADGLTKNVTCCPPIAISETNNFVLAESYVPGAKYCSGGNFIPGLPAEQGWARGVRIVLYGMALGYCFLGVAIIADRFMVAIEVITSKTKEIHVKNEVGSLEPVQVQVWNATISNLTLMALGSSAPEILLAVIETLGTMGKPAVEGLGPSCIVGSAAFNLLVISAICVLAIGNGEVRGIKQFGVFNITAFFSVFAYVWMYIVLMDSYVVAWEAWVTFMMAPLMTGLAYGQDKGWIWCRSKKYKIAHTPSKRALNGEGEFGREQKIHVGDKTTTGTYMSSFQSHQGMNEAMFKEVLEERARELGVAMTDVDPNEVAALCAKKINDKMPKSRAYYRTQANKAITGGNKASKVGTSFSLFGFGGRSSPPTHLPPASQHTQAQPPPPFFLLLSSSFSSFLCCCCLLYFLCTCSAFN